MPPQADTCLGNDCAEIQGCAATEGPNTNCVAVADPHFFECLDREQAINA